MAIFGINANQPFVTQAPTPTPPPGNAQNQAAQTNNAQSQNANAPQGSTVVSLSTQGVNLNAVTRQIPNAVTVTGQTSTVGQTQGATPGQSQNSGTGTSLSGTTGQTQNSTASQTHTAGTGQSLNSPIGQSLNQATPFHPYQSQFVQNLNPYQPPEVPAVQVWPVPSQPVQAPPPPPPGIQLAPGEKQGGHINTYA